MTVATETNIDGVAISARKWQDTYGNTYHTVQVSVFGDGNVTRYVEDEPTYGYGSSYMSTAKELLIDAGVLPNIDEDEMLWSQLRAMNIPWSTDECHVQRKKDLH